MKIRKQPNKYKKETKTETKKTWKSSHLMKRFQWEIEKSSHAWKE